MGPIYTLGWFYCCHKSLWSQMSKTMDICVFLVIILLWNLAFTFCQEGKEPQTKCIFNCGEGNQSQMGNLSGTVVSPVGKQHSLNFTVIPPIAYNMMKFGEYFNSIWLPIIVPIGFVGNVLSFLVMTSKQNRGTSCCVLMGALAASDTLMLYDGAHYWVRTNGLFAGATLNECRFICYCYAAFSLNGTILLVMMTFDRFIVVRFPLKAKTLCTSSRAKRIKLSGSYFSPLFFFTAIRNPPTYLSMVAGIAFNSLLSFLGISSSPNKPRKPTGTMSSDS